MRIIAGKYRNRKIHVPKDDTVRPTTGKAREAIFSILTSGRFSMDEKTILTDAVVIDLFCGTGSMSFEALSRGAKTTILVDENNTNLVLAKTTATSLGEEKNVSFIKTDIRYLPEAKIKCDLAFIDPPYNTDLATVALINLKAKNWLKPGSIVVVEISKLQDLICPEGFEEISQRIYGKTKVILLENVS